MSCVNEPANQKAVAKINRLASEGYLPQQSESMLHEMPEVEVDVLQKTSEAEHEKLAEEAKEKEEVAPKASKEECIKYDYRYVAIEYDGDYHVPFTSATNGRSYLKQRETKSSIWLLDLRDTSNALEPLRCWSRLQALMGMLQADVKAANQRLVDESYDLLRYKDGLENIIATKQVQLSKALRDELGTNVPDEPRSK